MQSIAAGTHKRDRPVVRLIDTCSHCRFVFSSLPVLALLAWMMHLAANRGNGHPKKRFVQREIEACRKVTIEFIALR